MVEIGGGMRYGTGAFLVVAAGLLWSLMGLAMRHIDEAGTWTILFWRSFGMLPVLVVFVAWRSGGHPGAHLLKVGWAGIIGGASLVLAFSGAIFAIQSTTIANAVFLFAASPFFAALLGWTLLGEPVRLATRVAIGVAAVGLFVMVREGLAGGALAGNLAALMSALGFAAFTITLRWGKLEDMLPAVVIGAAFAMIVAAAVLLAQGQTILASAHDIGISMGIGACLVACGMVLYTMGSKVVPAAELTLLSMVEVLLAPVWVWAFLDETASANTFLGGAILLLAITGNALSGLRRGRGRSPVG
jgi:DME family drug/metabolite transporter